MAVKFNPITFVPARLDEVPILIAAPSCAGPEVVVVGDKVGSLRTSLQAMFPLVWNPTIPEATRIFGQLFRRNLAAAMRAEGLQ
jgi:hypothetical protein